MNDGIGFLGAFILLLIFIPLALLWAFALLDLIRRNDLTGWKTALWLLLVIILPFVGALIYFIFRPKDVGRQQSSDFYRKFRPRK